MSDVVENLVFLTKSKLFDAPTECCVCLEDVLVDDSEIGLFNCDCTCVIHSKCMYNTSYQVAAFSCPICRTSCEALMIKRNLEKKTAAVIKEMFPSGSGEDGHVLLQGEPDAGQEDVISSNSRSTSSSTSSSPSLSTSSMSAEDSETDGSYMTDDSESSNDEGTYVPSQESSVPDPRHSNHSSGSGSSDESVVVVGNKRKRVNSTVV